ncbi:hypothetical protein AAG570_011868 [Ranatra chinensis]|uniref:Haloacid dehalogenase-like hydrolase domain-containing protein 3 n=1 Tax=Ranatra chinensis TaxID=642074 RepID=A0ABD0YHF8_9HEMI
MYSRVGRLHGVQSEPTAVYQNFKKGWCLMNQEHPNYGLKTGITWTEWWRKLVKKSLGDHPGSLKAADELIKIFGTAEGWRPIDGALPLLDELKGSNIDLGIISNFDPRLQPILISLGMDGYFTFVTTSYDAGVLKPDPAIFKYSENLYKKLTGKDLDGRNALHIGDSYELDYSSALSVGWNAALVNSSGLVTQNTDCGQVFRDLYELRTYFKNVLKTTQLSNLKE